LVPRIPARDLADAVEASVLKKAFLPVFEPGFKSVFYFCHKKSHQKAGGFAYGREEGIDPSHPCEGPFRRGKNIRVKKGFRAFFSNRGSNPCFISAIKKATRKAGGFAYGREEGIDDAHPCASPLRGAI